MSRLLAVFVLLAASALAVDVNLAWDNPEAGTYDGIVIYSVSGGKTNEVEVAAGVSNLVLRLPRQSVNIISARAWAGVEGQKETVRIYSEFSDSLKVRVPASPSKPRLPR